MYDELVHKWYSPNEKQNYISSLRVYKIKFNQLNKSAEVN